MRLQIERNGLDTPTQLPGELLSYPSVSWRMTRIEISKEKTICQLEETLNTSSLRASTFLPQRNSDEGLMNLKKEQWNESALPIGWNHHQRAAHRCLLGCRRQMTVSRALIEAANNYQYKERLQAGKLSSHSQAYR